MKINKAGEQVKTVQMNQTEFQTNSHLFTNLLIRVDLKSGIISSLKMTWLLKNYQVEGLSDRYTLGFISNIWLGNGDIKGMTEDSVCSGESRWVKLAWTFLTCPRGYRSLCLWSVSRRRRLCQPIPPRSKRTKKWVSKPNKHLPQTQSVPWGRLTAAVQPSGVYHVIYAINYCFDIHTGMRNQNNINCGSFL